MEKLVEFLTSKIGYTIAVIGGFLFPGLIFIFVWDRELFASLNVVVLFTFSMAISFMVYIPNFLAFSFAIFTEAKMRNKETDYEFWMILLIPLFVTVAEMSAEMIEKLHNPSITIYRFAIFILSVIIVGSICKYIVELIYKLYRQKKNK